MVRVVFPLVAILVVVTLVGGIEGMLTVVGREVLGLEEPIKI